MAAAAERKWRTRPQRRHLAVCSVLLMSELYNKTLCTCKPHVIIGRMDEHPIAEARANLSELAVQVRLLRKVVMLTRRGRAQVAIVPAELAEAVEEVGGPDKATDLLRGTKGAK